MPRNLRTLITILRARIGVLILTLLITVVTAAIVTDLLPRRYVATTSLVLDSTDSSPFNAPNVGTKGSTTYLATQIDIIRSRGVALDVVDALGLADDPEAQSRFAEEYGNLGSIREWLADRLLDGLSVEPSRDSRVISISFESSDATMAASIANAFAQAYIDKTLKFTVDPARRNAQWFDEQLKHLRQRLLESQARLTSFQQEHGIISIDERLDSETNRLNELSKSYVQVQAEASDVRSRQLGRNHPEYKRAISREQALARSLEEQKHLLLELKKQRDQLHVLAREVESNQRVYDAALEKYYQNSLESQFNLENVSVLNEAVPPLEPSSPNLILNYASAVLFGLLLGGFFAVVAEMNDRRIRSAEDVIDMTGTRIIAAI
jgi:succinoglycan biosynthesis transport protein ExoP